MSVVNAVGTVWNCPNFLGELFTASPLQTPVLQMSGGLNGVKSTNNFEFPIDQTYTHAAASQPSVTETASQSAATITTQVRTQHKNVCQIHFEAVSLSYAKLSAMGRLETAYVLTAGQQNVPTSELDWQIAKALEKIARDVEYSFIQGLYVPSTSASVASTTRGLNVAALSGSTVAAGGAALSKTLIDTLLRAMYTAGAVFKNPVFVVNAFQKQQLSKIYGYAPTDRNVGGLNIKQIESDFGNLGVILDAFQATDTVLIADMAFVTAVTQPVPGKGNMFYEALGKVAAAEVGQIYGQIGLN